MSDNGEVDVKDIMRILVATDNHLGYGEKDAVRGEDSFIAFEEILEMAVYEDVDFILLGGDLFHDAAPSQNTMNRCIKLLRTYTLGSKPIAIEYLSGQKENFHETLNKSVNYQDPNLNVSIPVFSIHGNHDDPSGFGRLSALDLLANMGLINYFGCWSDLTKVEISPLLLRKGETKLAIFGLSHIADERLSRLFENGKVVIECPEPISDWFNLMMLHQNRADRGPKKYLPEEALPDFMNLVIWGHEHDCRIVPEYNVQRDFYVCQPGSSVPTSLAEGEALSKHVGLLEIYKSKFQMKPLPLRSPRPFVFKSVNLVELVDELGLDEGDTSNKVKQMAKDHVEAMIESASKQLTGHPNQPILPLIRLRIVFTAEQQMFNAIRFGQQYNQMVANPTDMVHFKKMVKKIKHEGRELDPEMMKMTIDKAKVDDEVPIEDILNRYFNDVEYEKKLSLVPSKILSEACSRLVQHKDNDAAERIIKFYSERVVDHLMDRLPGEEALNDEITNFKESESSIHDDILQMLDARDGKKTGSSKTAATRGRGRGSSSAATTTGTRAARGKWRGKGFGNEMAAPNEDDEKNVGRPKRQFVKPKLDISTSSSRTTRSQKTLLDVIDKKSSSRSSTAKRTTIIFSDSDDDFE